MHELSCMPSSRWAHAESMSSARAHGTTPDLDRWTTLNTSLCKQLYLFSPSLYLYVHVHKHLSIYLFISLSLSLSSSLSVWVEATPINQGLGTWMKEQLVNRSHDVRICSDQIEASKGQLQEQINPMAVPIEHIHKDLRVLSYRFSCVSDPGCEERQHH